MVGVLHYRSKTSKQINNNNNKFQFYKEELRGFKIMVHPREAILSKGGKIQFKTRKG